MNDKFPRCVLSVSIERIYFHCSKAIVRSRLWDANVDDELDPCTHQQIHKFVG